MKTNITLLISAALVSTSTAAVVNQYHFNDGTADDSVGSANGTLVGTSGVITNGKLNLSGNNGEGSQNPGNGSYVNLPDNIISDAALSGVSGSLTLEFWATSSVNRNWAVLLSAGGAAGTGGQPFDYIHIIPRHGAAGNTFRATTHVANNATEGFVDDTSELSTTTQQHIVVVFDQSGGTPGTLELFIDGASVGSAAMANMDLTGFINSENFLGRAQYNDPLFDGTIDEFTIHDTALTAAEVTSEFNTGPFNPDTDNDGLPNSWEIANGLDPNDDGSTNVNNGPNGDPDSDNMSNLGRIQQQHKPPAGRHRHGWLQ